LLRPRVEWMTRGRAACIGSYGLACLRFANHPANHPITNP
jgi:hypothetical protein